MALKPTPEQLEAFASLQWATPFVESPDWIIGHRTRGKTESLDDRFTRDTMRANDGMQQWIELYQKPTDGSKLVTRSISLCQYGPGLMGFPTICHGGAVMTMMDEALAFAMVANESEAAGVGISGWAEIGGGGWWKQFEEGKSLVEILKGFLVTARLDLKFMKPVPCPGIVGIEVTMLENKGHKMSFRGVMKDSNGTPLVQADGTWVRLGGVAKI